MVGYRIGREPLATYEGVVTIRGRTNGLPRLHDQRTDETPTLLGHLMKVGVVPARARWGGHKLIGEGAAWGNRLLGKLGYAVHAHGYLDSVPVDGGRLC